MAEVKEGRTVKVAGPVVVAEGMTGSRMYDVVRVGKFNLKTRVNDKDLAS